MIASKELKIKLEQAGVEKQTYYRQYISVLNRKDTAKTINVLGFEITQKCYFHDYASKYGSASNSHRYLYHYHVNGITFFNFASLAAYIRRQLWKK